MARVLIIASIINLSLLPKLAAPLGLSAAILTGIGIFLLLKPTCGTLRSEIALANPLILNTVLAFGFVLSVIAVAFKIATIYASGAGADVVAAISGKADVDAVTLSMSRLARADVSVDIAERVILIVVAVNTISKACLAWAIGDAEIRKSLLAIAAAALAAGALGYQLSTLSNAETIPP